MADECRSLGSEGHHEAALKVLGLADEAMGSQVDVVVRAEGQEVRAVLAASAGRLEEGLQLAEEAAETLRVAAEKHPALGRLQRLIDIIKKEMAGEGAK